MNEVLSTILEILKYTIPSGIVFVTAYFLMRKFFDQQRKIELLRAKSNQTATTPGSNNTAIRLQAYERLILLLERIEPSQMVPRVHTPGISGAVFARELQKTVRDEYEHNLTQQIYVSEQAWNKVIESRNAVNQLVNLAAKKVGENATGVQFSTALFEILTTAGISPTNEGIEILRSEARQLL